MKRTKLIKMLRNRVSPTSPQITNKELQEVEDKINIRKYFDDRLYEFNSHHIITKSLEERNNALERMCCGIREEDIILDSGEIIYFAFDYGH